MNPNITAFLKKHYRYLIFVLVALIASYGAIEVIVTERLEDLQAELQVKISEQQALLTTIAETTARNGADATTETVVQDCSVTERTDFDDLLGKLDTGLSNSDLAKLERLFGRCGTFYSARKAVMVARLSRELEVYEAYLAQLEAIASETAVESYQLEKWRALTEQEKEQSVLFRALVQQQDQIIKTLLSGKSTQSDEIKAILGEVKQTQASLIMAHQQAASLRAELVPL